MRRRQMSSRCESDRPTFNGINHEGHEDDDNHEEHEGHEAKQITKQKKLLCDPFFVSFVFFVVSYVFVVSVVTGARMTSRRIFLKSGAMAMLSLGFAPSFLGRA